MTTNRTVTVGDQSYPIQRFRGLKAILAVAAMTRIAKEVPDILADAAKEYQQRNTLSITEPMSRLPRWEGFSKEDFDAAEEATGKRVIEMPAPMTQNEQILQALPRLLEEARNEVVRLFAILIIPNETLKQADKEDKVEEALDQYRDVLLYDSELDQLADLAIAAHAVLTEQLADRKGPLGKALSPLVRMLRPRWIQQQPSMSEIPTETESDEKSTSPTSTDSVPSLSTDSELPTDGPETRSSMASLGASS